MAAAGEERITFSQVLARPDFFRLWLSQAISVVGDKLTQVAFTIYVLQLAKGSAAAVGVGLASQVLPLVIIGPFAGVLVDRWDKRRTMVVSDLLRGAIVAAMSLLGDARLAYLFMFAHAAVGTVFTPAMQASMPELLGDRKEIMAANSLVFSTRYFTDIIGFALGAVIIGTIGVKLAFLIDALTFVVSAALLVGIKKRLAVGEPKPISVRGFLRDLGEGFRYHRDNPVVLSLLISFTGGVLFMGGLNALLIVAVDRLLAVDKSWWGYLLAVQAATMSATVIALGRWAQKVPRPRVIIPGFLVIGICAFSLGFSRSLTVSFLIYAALGVANAAWLIPSITWLQEIVPFEFRGRVMSLRGMVINLSAVISYPVGGQLGDLYGVTPVLAAIGVFLVLIALGSAALPGFREAFLTRGRAGAAA